MLCLKIVKCKERPYGCWHGCLLNCLYCPVWQGERVWRLGPTLRHWQNIVMAQLIELDLPCTIHTHDFSVLLVNWIITVCYWQAFTFFCFVISLSVRAACARRSSVFVDIATLQFFGYFGFLATTWSAVWGRRASVTMCHKRAKNPSGNILAIIDNLGHALHTWKANDLYLS